MTYLIIGRAGSAVCERQASPTADRGHVPIVRRCQSLPHANGRIHHVSLPRKEFMDNAREFGKNSS